MPLSTDTIRELPELGPDERSLLPEEMTQYTIVLSIWRLTWEDMRALRAAGDDDTMGLGILDKALVGIGVTLTNGQQRRLSRAAALPFPLLGASLRLLRKAMDEATDPNG